MKTSEFIDAVKGLRRLRLKIEAHDVAIVVKNRPNEYVLVVDTGELYSIDTRFDGFKALSDNDKIKLYELCTKYIMTNVEEREEQKKYKLRHKLVEGIYLNYFKDRIEDENKLRFSTGEQIGVYKTEFTIQEWETLTEQTWEDLLIQFKAIEV